MASDQGAPKNRVKQGGKGGNENSADDLARTLLKRATWSQSSYDGTAESEAYLNQVLAMAGISPDVRAEALIAKGDGDPNADWYHQALATPGVSLRLRAIGLLRLGWSFSRLEYSASQPNYQDFLPAFAEVLAMEDVTPEFRAEAQSGIGNLLQRLGQDDEALPYLSEALAYPKLSKATQERVLYAQAKIFERQGRIGSALRAYDLIARLVPFRGPEERQFYPPYLEERDALVRKHWDNITDFSDDMRYEEAVEFGRRGSRTGSYGSEPSEIDEGNLSAWAKAGLGLYDAALKELDYALQEYWPLPHDHLLDTEAMRSWISARKSEVAASYTTEPLIPANSVPEGLIAIAELRSQANFHLRTQRISSAFALYDEIYSHPSAFPFHRADALERKGTFLLDQGEGESALANFVLMEKIPSLPPYYQTMATLRCADAYEQIGKREDAIALFERVGRSRSTEVQHREYAERRAKDLQGSSSAF